MSELIHPMQSDLRFAELKQGDEFVFVNQLEVHVPSRKLNDDWYIQIDGDRAYKCTDPYMVLRIEQAHPGLYTIIN